MDTDKHGKILNKVHIEHERKIPQPFNPDPCGLRLLSAFSRRKNEQWVEMLCNALCSSKSTKSQPSMLKSRPG